MVLWGVKADLTELLRITAEYSKHWKIEFSGAKSMVVPIGVVQGRGNNTWCIGNTPIPEHPDRLVTMGELKEARYLGITWQRVYNMYAPQGKLAIQKARRCAALKATMVCSTHDPVRLARGIWGTLPCQARTGHLGGTTMTVVTHYHDSGHTLP